MDNEIYQQAFRLGELWARESEPADVEQLRVFQAALEAGDETADDWTLPEEVSELIADLPPDEQDEFLLGFASGATGVWRFAL